MIKDESKDNLSVIERLLAIFGTYMLEAVTLVNAGDVLPGLSADHS